MKDLIKEIFAETNETYGYRRITEALKRRGHRINEKRVRRLMREMNIRCTKFGRKTRKYSSYKGTVGKIAPNRFRRRFSCAYRLQKLTTDITEFKTHTEKKLYLSPVLDLYNSEIVSYKISDRPTLDLAIDPVLNALNLAEKHAAYRTTIHSDQGWQYQHGKYQKIITSHNAFQSMSRKGNCLDNSPMENFFGLLKQEMYYGEELVSYEELKVKIENYIHYYNTKRIKIKLAGLSPVQYREQTSQLAA